MKQKEILMYGIATVAAIAGFVLVRRYIGRQKIKRLKEQEIDPTEKVADVQTNFDNNQSSENW